MLSNAMAAMAWCASSELGQHTPTALPLWLCQPTPTTKAKFHSSLSCASLPPPAGPTISAATWWTCSASEEMPCWQDWSCTSSGGNAGSGAPHLIQSTVLIPLPRQPDQTAEFRSLLHRYQLRKSYYHTITSCTSVLSADVTSDYTKISSAHKEGNFQDRKIKPWILEGVGSQPVLCQIQTSEMLKTFTNITLQEHSKWFSGERSRTNQHCVIRGQQVLTTWVIPATVE